MNRLSIEEQTKVIASLVEGNSIRATCRMTGVAKGTVTRLLEAVGKACDEYQDVTLRDLPCKNIQCDEIWSFCYAKEKNVPKEHKGQFGYGDVWTWTAIDADTKLVPSWYIGTRDAQSAYEFLHDLKIRLAHRIQITTDGHRAYAQAVEEVFGSDVDYGMLVKIYGKPQLNETRYSPTECVGAEKHIMQGLPSDEKISTSYVERQNLTMRMSMRRFTRLTNAFSKKIENLEHAVGLHFMWYNFCRPHKALNMKRSLGVTPAMAAGVATKAWTIEDLIYLTFSN
jgi:IS1 family transposase